jgi:group I intron endonuclease
MFAIYEIKNIINGHRYIGCSKNIKSRFYHHVRSLNNNKHINQYLQYAWNKYKSESFNFNIIAECSSEKEMYEKEKEIIATQIDLYNIFEGGLGGDRITNHPNKKKYILSLKKASNKRFLNEEEKQKCNSFKGLTEDQRNQRLKVWSDCKIGNKNNNFKWNIPVFQIDIKSGEIIKEYQYPSEVTKYGYNDGAVINCCLGKKNFKTHKGYIWKFKTKV